MDKETLDKFVSAIPALQALAENAYALAQSSVDHGSRRLLDRVGTQASDLMTALIELRRSAN